MNPKKNILFVTSWYPSRLNATLGIFVKRHAQAVVLHNNVSVMYVCSDEAVKSSDGYDVEESVEENIYTVRVYYKKVTSQIPILSTFLKILRNRKAYLKAYHLVVKNSGKPDLVHGNMLVPACTFAYYLKRKYNIPYLVTENWTGFLPSDGYYKGFLLKTITKLVANNASYLIPVSQDLKNALLQHGFTKPNYEIVPNVVNVNLFKQKQIQTKAKIRAIHVSALDNAQKNISGILNVVAKIAQKRNDFELVIVGDGNDRNALEQEAKQLNILNSVVFFKGLKLGVDLVNEFEQSDFFVLFSNYENLPCVIIEAMSTGLPVVVSRIGGTPEHVTDKIGLIVEPKNEQQLETAFNTMLQTYTQYSTDYIHNYAEEHFSYEKVALQFEAIYQKMLHA